MANVNETISSGSIPPQTVNINFIEPGAGGQYKPSGFIAPTKTTPTTLTIPSQKEVTKNAPSSTVSSQQINPNSIANKPPEIIPLYPSTTQNISQQLKTEQQNQSYNCFQPKSMNVPLSNQICIPAGSIAIPVYPQNLRTMCGSGTIAPTALPSGTTTSTTTKVPSSKKFSLSNPLFIGIIVLSILILGTILFFIIKFFLNRQKNNQQQQVNNQNAQLSACATKATRVASSIINQNQSQSVQGQHQYPSIPFFSHFSSNPVIPQKNLNEKQKSYQNLLYQ